MNTNHTTRRSTRRLGATALVALLIATGAACADDDAGADAESSTTTSAHEHHRPTTTDTTTVEAPVDDASDGELVIGASDYRFEGVPESVPAGTRLRIENRSGAELHEIVAFRLPDSETRPFDELMSLGQAELTAAFGGPPVAVLVQPPGGPAIDAVGDGTLAEPGRYVLICTIPTGANPGEYMQAAAAARGGPVTGVAGGPPHLVQGMAAELLVE